MFEAVFLILGIITGSFLNVVICRIPNNNSLIYPASHCPQCRQRLAWLELVPIFSYLWQRGKCRHCNTAISVQYPAVELATGLIYLWLYIHFGLTVKLAVALLFVSLLIPLVVIDLRHQIIPDSLNGLGAIAGFLTIVISGNAFLDAVTGAFIGGGIMLFIAIISRGGMGGGDIKMMAWLGLFLGWKLTLLALIIAFVTGGVGSLLLILLGIKKRKDFIPFGPFLALGGFAAYIFGERILHWYLTIK